ncbi:magnesium transporter [Patescibacteria group bacterium]|nr:magnesium transporter [Patescibacteria group bacterium]
MNEALNKTQKFFLRLIRHKAYGLAFNIIRKGRASDLADLFRYLTPKQKQWFADSVLKSHQLAAVLSEMEDDLVVQFISLINKKDLIPAIEKMNPDDAADLFLTLKEEERQTLLRKLNKEQRLTISRLLGFGPHTAGGIMTTDFLALSEDVTSAKAISLIKKQERRSEILYIYVIDHHQQLVGVISFRQLVLAQRNQRLSNLMEKDPISISVDEDQEEASSKIAKYNLLALPVVDDHHCLVGQITVDDAMDVLYEEATEDIYHLASLDTEEHVSTPALHSTRLRFPWLVLNLLTCILAALSVSFFEETIEKYVVLAVLLPVVAGMGGNAGTQSLVVVTRGLALGEIDWRSGIKTIFKEIKVGSLNGFLLGVMMAVITFLWYHNLALSLVIFLAMLGNLFIAGLFGSLVPLFLRKLKLDPALGSSIFVTTATDVFGFVFYLGLATLLINFII